MTFQEKWKDSKCEFCGKPTTYVVKDGIEYMECQNSTEYNKDGMKMGWHMSIHNEGRLQTHKAFKEEMARLEFERWFPNEL